MDIVLDTNILVAAAFNPHSDAARIIEGIRRGSFRLVWNDATHAETRRIMRKIPPLNWDEFADLYQQAGRFEGDTNPDRYRDMLDPMDRAFAALADAAGAVLISNDDDLLRVRDQLPATVMRSSEFVSHHA